MDCRGQKKGTEPPDSGGCGHTRRRGQSHRTVDVVDTPEEGNRATGQWRPWARALKRAWTAEARRRGQSHRTVKVVDTPQEGDRATGQWRPWARVLKRAWTAEARRRGKSDRTVAAVGTCPEASMDCRGQQKGTEPQDSGGGGHAP
ncbi:hypothetical protein NDU88_009426 [Pleurodeles waltl]|uniref:Uncharacterized protein n=1 Tax=Pleurodeles waltl TaxID=8319 RepID=A0AAV7NZ18_PLEWA|nr:hypothetical protein NDU88_009426 [Pleurodeles waltl]